MVTHRGASHIPANSATSSDVGSRKDVSLCEHIQRDLGEFGVVESLSAFTGGNEDCEALVKDSVFRLKAHSPRSSSRFSDSLVSVTIGWIVRIAAASLAAVRSWSSVVSSAAW